MRGIVRPGNKPIRVRQSASKDALLVDNLGEDIAFTTSGDIAFSADGKQLFTGSWDRTTRLWEVSTGALVRYYRGQ